MMEQFQYNLAPVEPTRAEALARYLENFSARDDVRAQHIMKSIMSPAQPLARHLVMIPVAAHQESAQIAPAITQYAKQTSDQPFTVVLGLNSPVAERNNPAITATMSEIESARSMYPHLDIRTAMTFYESPTIGMVRRDLWNGALLASLSEEAYFKDDREVIGINNDIDVVSMSPRYISRIQKYYESFETDTAEYPHSPLPVSSTNIKHAPSPAHPNVSKGVYWTDFLHRQMNVSYEAGLVIPMSTYARRGGFSVDSRTHETRPFLTDHPQAIAGTTIGTSPRRYIDRLRYGYKNIWTDDSFGPNDECRERRHMADITSDQLDTLILGKDALRANMLSIALVGTNQYTRAHLPATELQTQSEAKAERQLLLQNLERIVDKKLHLAAEVLKRVIKSDAAVSVVTRMQTDEHFKKAVLESYYYFYED